MLESSIVQQHRNKLRLQSLEIGRAVMGIREAQVLSIACGGCLDRVPILPILGDFAGEIVSMTANQPRCNWLNGA